jgi:hypothetical protein
MGQPLRRVPAPSPKIDGRFATGAIFAEANFRPELFGQVARVVWPRKPDVQIAVIARCSPRAAREYLNGNVAPPAIVIAAMFTEIARRA